MVRKIIIIVVIEVPIYIVNVYFCCFPDNIQVVLRQTKNTYLETFSDFFHS